MLLRPLVVLVALNGFDGAAIVALSCEAFAVCLGHVAGVMTICIQLLLITRLRIDWTLP